LEKTKEKKEKLGKLKKKVILKKNWKKKEKKTKKKGKVRKNKKKIEKKTKKREKLQKKKWERITVDYCCNPQWNVCGETVIPPHHLDYVLIQWV